MKTLVAAAALLLSQFGEAGAQTLFDRAPPRQRIVHRSLVAARVNPLGLIYDGRVGYRHRLFASESRALRDNFLGVGAAATVTPAFAKIGPYVEVAPASVITLWGAAQVVGYYGTFDQLQSFPTAGADYSDDALERLGPSSYGAAGMEATLGLDLQVRVGPVLLRSRGRLQYADIDLREGDTVYYDQMLDTVLPDGGFAATDDIDAAWMGLGNRLVVGLRYTATVPFHDEGDDTATQRIGPLVAYSFKVRDGAAFNAPTLFLLAQWWLTHRYRTGAETSRALPLLGLGFSFYGDLLSFDGG